MEGRECLMQSSNLHVERLHIMSQSQRWPGVALLGSQPALWESFTDLDFSWEDKTSDADVASPRLRYVPVLHLSSKETRGSLILHQPTPINRTSGKLSRLGQIDQSQAPWNSTNDPCHCGSGWARLGARPGRRDVKVGQVRKPCFLAPFTIISW